MNIKVAVSKQNPHLRCQSSLPSEWKTITQSNALASEITQLNNTKAAVYFR